MASPPSRENALAERVYTLIKDDIFSFRLLPGDRFTETEMAQRCGASRTPVRDALYRLEREGYLHVAFRSGWRVRPLDFERFEQLYDLRIVLEAAAVTRICEAPDAVDLTCLQQVWLTEPAERVCDCGEGDQWPKERKPIFFMVSPIAMFRCRLLRTGAPPGIAAAD